jgi:hypothetical protein
MLFKNKGKIILISDIKKAYLPVKAISTTTEKIIVFLASAMADRRRSYFNKRTVILLDLKNEKTVAIYTRLDDDIVSTIIEKVNRLIK